MYAYIYVCVCVGVCVCVCCDRGKKQRDYTFIPTRRSPDEWATTKQTCQDELVVYLSFSSHNICMYVYIYIKVELISKT